MSVRSDLVQIEHDGWRALSSDGPTAADFYGRVLADEALMLLPGGIVLHDRARIIDSMGGAPWDSFSLSDERVLELGAHTAVVAYRAHARRGEREYDALCNSTYVRVGERWRLALHQQTPIGAS